MRLLDSRVKPYLFPGLVVLVLVALTLAKVSGSSVGAFNTYLYGQPNERPELLVNQPREIRSDEWELNTPLTVAQVTSGFPRFNQDIGEGQDMSIVLDVPYKEWSTFFKPQNWSFFVLPLEYAFAFKWWFLGAALMLAMYYFTLTILPGRYLLASLLAVALFFSPFVQWWYLSISILSLAYGLAITALCLRLIDSKLGIGGRLLLGVALAYCATCLGLQLYLPFVFAVVLVVGFVVIGAALNAWRSGMDTKLLRAGLLITGGALAISAIFGAAYIFTRMEVIETIRGTVYPGNRIELNGDFPLTHFGSGFFNGQLQSQLLAGHVPINQSEFSNFLLIFLFLWPALLFRQFIKFKAREAVDFRVIMIGVLSVILLIRLFAPSLDWLSSITELDRIPHTRLLIAFGLLNAVGLVLFAEEVLKGWQLRNYGSHLLALAAALIVGLVGFLTKNQYDGFLESWGLIAVISLTVGVTVYCFQTGRLSIGAGIMAIFLVASTAGVNPLYRGLSPIIHSEVSEAVRQTGDSLGSWVVSEDVIFENVLPANGLRSLTGVYSYPQLQLWSDLKRTESDEDIYNRFAHVFFTIEAVDASQYPVGAYLDPPATDAFRVHADPCSEFLARRGVRYILTSYDKAGLPCLTELRRVEYPTRTFRIYQIN